MSQFSKLIEWSNILKNGYLENRTWFFYDEKILNYTWKNTFRCYHFLAEVSLMGRQLNNTIITTDSKIDVKSKSMWKAVLGDQACLGRNELVNILQC